MMDYESFKSVLIKRIKEFLPEKYWEWEITESRIPKVNGFKESINLMPTSKDGYAVPNIYVSDMYEYYQDCRDMERVLKKIGEFFVEAMEYAQSVTQKMELGNMQDKIIMVLVNTKENKELLASVPNRSLMDLSIIYRLMIDLPDATFNSVIITNELAEKLKLNEAELYDIAKEKTPKVMPKDVDVLSEDFFIVTNKYRTFGAIVMLYDDVLADIATEFDTSLYILPSSIHEVFIVTDYFKDANELRGIVAEANATVVNKEEVLSNNVYLYEKKTGRLSIV